MVLMTPPAIYALIRFWLPLVTFFGLLIKGALLAGKRISNWADTFLDNHMNHIQESAEKAAVAVTELTKYHEGATILQKEMVSQLTGIRSELSEQGKQILGTQHQIITGIEILKDRD
jgi:hypothetical protein